MNAEDRITFLQRLCSQLLFSGLQFSSLKHLKLMYGGAMGFRFACYALRTTLFYSLFGILVFVVLITLWPFIYLFPRLPFWIFSFLAHLMLIFLRIFLGIRLRFENVHFLRDIQKQFNSFLIASKHQSELETLLFALFLNSFKIVYKKEIDKVPVIGAYMRCMGFIAIDRRAGRRAVTDLIEKGRNAAEQGRPVLIFPEGTRTSVGQKGRYHAGVALMYKEIGIPILPVAHNAGAVFPPHVFVKKPGVITVCFLPPIFPGLEVAEALSELEERIETGCQRLN